MDNVSAILIGGGLDSTILAMCVAEWVDTPPLLIHATYGQKADASEFASVCRTATSLGLPAPVQLFVDMSYSGAHIMKNTPVGVERSSNVLSLRNPTLIALACSYLSSTYSSPSSLYVGFHKEPPGKVFPDADADYLPSLEAVLRACGGTTSLYVPFQYMTRQQIVDLGLSMNRDLVLNCHTCYEEVACGLCPHCVERTAMLSKEIEK